MLSAVSAYFIRSRLTGCPVAFAKNRVILLVEN